ICPTRTQKRRPEHKKDETLERTVQARDRPGRRSKRWKEQSRQGIGQEGNRNAGRDGPGRISWEEDRNAVRDGPGRDRPGRRSKRWKGRSREDKPGRRSKRWKGRSKQ
ncbi:hypothetical protein J6590_040840, partial [Homalodisca vitripennis]